MERMGLIAGLVLLIIILVLGCSYEREVQASFSVGKVIKVEPLQNRYLIKVEDIHNSIIYTDYFSENPLTLGQTVVIIIKR